MAGKLFNPKNQLLTPAELQDILQCSDNLPQTLHFRNLDLYQTAFTHKSYTWERHQEQFRSLGGFVPPGCVPLQSNSNKELEWIGDAVLQLVVAELLLERYPDLGNESGIGKLTQMRIAVVTNKAFGLVAQDLAFDELLLIDCNLEHNNGGRKNLELLGDCFEAFVGALYRDLGVDACRTWLAEVLRDSMDAAAVSCGVYRRQAAGSNVG
ncbi:hypothetical protein HYH03_000021 [Edaphochlamys debaryana]|uniref:RNase III domain-containing protein n=1 Tax=Edaphochlamys debaryana TaxID=47281 RepID=A0A835YPK5_9CHLO|nr:hypothetical protein HYH03_000021 [Edaphochlamys debaryana]|eukprot:KAG2501514.1 hypothetical protein HYH03_000021 [Edaphochlamys debaryana]